MQQGTISRSAPHEGDDITGFYAFPFTYPERPVVPVSAQVRLTVLDNNKLAVADESTPAVHHFAVRRSANFHAVGTPDAHARGVPAAFAETPDQRSGDRPAPLRRRSRRGPDRTGRRAGCARAACTRGPAAFGSSGARAHGGAGRA